MATITGYDCYKVMTELEQRRWMRNGIIKGDVNVNVLLDLDYHNFSDFIESSFDWTQTKEGLDYWITICEKYKIHDQLNPGQYFKTKPPKTF